MKGGLLTMSTCELDRITVIKKVAEKAIKQREAMAILNLSKRQIIRDLPAALRATSVNIF